MKTARCLYVITTCQIFPAKRCEINVLTMPKDDDSVFAPLRAGARGYVLKGADIARGYKNAAHVVRRVLIRLGPTFQRFAMRFER